MYKKTYGYFLFVMRGIKKVILVTILFALSSLVGELNWSGSDDVKIIQSSTYAQAAPLADSKTYIPVILNNIQENTLFGVEMYKITSGGGLDKMTEAGISWIRHNDTRAGPETSALIWTAVEPNKGDRNWSAMVELEEQLINASKYGKKVILIVRSTPYYARDPRWKNSYCGPIDPNHYQDFANFMFDAVKRYSVRPYNVKHWEIYNEPDYPITTQGYPYGEPHGCWGTFQKFYDPYNNGRAYGEMLKVVYPKIKSADPEAQVLTGGVLLDCDPRPNPLDGLSQCTKRGKDETFPKFFEGILVSGAGNSFNGVSFHSYEYYPWWFGEDFGHFVNDEWNSSWNTTGPVLVKKVEYILQLLQQYSVFGKDLYSTENSLIHSHIDFLYEHGVCKPFNVDYENTKASNIVQTYTHSKALGLKTNIYFHVFGWRCSALLENKDTPVQPAYDAYQFAANRLGPAVFIREITTFPAVKVFEFQYYESEAKFWVVWSLDGNINGIFLPTIPTGIWDMVGNKVPVAGQNFNTTLVPHYIDF